MSCLGITPPAPPTLPGGLTLGAAVPSISFDPTLCCKILPFPVNTPPLPLPPLVFNPAVIAAINLAMSQLVTYFDALSVSCPLE